MRRRVDPPRSLTLAGNPVLPCDGSGGLASAVLSARILCPVGILPHFWKGLRRVCRALEGDGADRNLPILEATRQSPSQCKLGWGLLRRYAPRNDISRGSPVTPVMLELPCRGHAARSLRDFVQRYFKCFRQVATAFSSFGIFVLSNGILKSASWRRSDTEVALLNKLSTGS